MACIPFSPDTFALGPRDYVARFLVLFSALRGGQTRYLPLLLAKVSDVLPSLPLPRSVQNVHIGVSPGQLGSGPSSISDDLSSLSSVSSPSYPSTELIRQLAAQTGAQLPFNTSQQPLLSAPASRVGDISLYDPSPPLTTHSSGSNHSSQNPTPTPYQTSPGQEHAQPNTHTAVQVATSHSHMHGHHLGVNPTAYDPRFDLQGFPVDPSMVFKSDDTDSTGHMHGQRGMFAQDPQRVDHGVPGHSRRHGGGYAG